MESGEDFGPWTEALVVAWLGIPQNLKKKEALTFSGGKVAVSLQWSAPSSLNSGLTLSKYKVQYSTNNASYANINNDGLTAETSIDQTAPDVEISTGKVHYKVRA